MYRPVPTAVQSDLQSTERCTGTFACEQVAYCLHVLVAPHNGLPPDLGTTDRAPSVSAARATHGAAGAWWCEGEATGGGIGGGGGAVPVSS
jgi:hypothetical protein